ncbi:MAG TPA: PQQ-binding-like beta-propeller repeat protein, partial [Planctomycetaceae bacterium]|nr:PQQ-binding-like beta-propeller repeat protein [Planctomycetaceae bacterium]
MLRQVLFVFAALSMPLTLDAAQPWPQWRGPHGDGHVTEDVPPLAWTGENVVWEVALPGAGQSSPVIWDDRIFLTASEKSGGERLVFALNRRDGKLLWKQTAWTGAPEPSHQMNGWASATCATDGERVYAFFGRGGGLFCYSRDGEKLWDLPLGDFPGPWGTAACPIVVENLVLQNCDSEGDARLIGVDKLTGKIVWSTPRENQRGWSTPLIVSAGGQTQAVINGHSGTRCYAV